ncbi:hypothetical protein CTRI78_v006818 [Colletotrichum trifolii]|uniref:Sterol uptake control protein 2 n=1 Tax=Colletotrichum trifolii TaxID=5466 RepID=A0A4R8RB88_COLTR|nr:hypothetical protein CTRI78_v006818 [Colletotrichum trifolii]
MQYVWRVLIPEMGYSCSFVMHGILTVAALHKAYLIPSEREMFLDLAASYSNAGLETFRATLHLIDNDNWENYFGFASLVVLYVSALPVRNSKNTNVVASFFELFLFVRGIRTLLATFEEGVGRTKFAPFAHSVWIVDPDDEETSKNAPLDRSPLPRDVYEALQGLSSFYEDNLQGDSRGDYVAAVKDLRRSINLMAYAGINIEIGMLLFWPYVISENVMADIQAQNPYAILLLCYFSVLLCALEQRYWFLKGWSRRLFGISDERLKEHPALAEMAKWPRRQVSELYGTP